MKIKTTNNQILIVIIGIILSIIAGFYQISLAEVTAAEYFIDEDPGEGNGTSLLATDVFDSPQSLLRGVFIGYFLKGNYRVTKPYAAC